MGQTVDLINRADYMRIDFEVMSACTISATKQCDHANGWFHNIPRRLIGFRRMFFCSDCGEMMTMKEFNKRDAEVAIRKLDETMASF